MRFWQVLIAALVVTGGEVRAEVLVAVAANFQNTARLLADEHAASGGEPVALVSGSTGKLYAQIVNGAPFDMFLAADQERPRRLAEAGVGVGEPRTYAIGRLVLWSRDPGLVDPGARVLATNDFRYLAIANPELAPYGAAARNFLTRRGLWKSVENRLVRGENVIQAYQFASTGNADLGLVSLSQSIAAGDTGSSWHVPSDSHAEIAQDSLLLSDQAAARDFYRFIHSERGAAIISNAGYLVPFSGDSR